MDKEIKKITGIKIFWIGLFIWSVGTWYGGFSIKPQSAFEFVTDRIGVLLMYWGIVKDILSGVTYSKVTNIKTDNVEAT